MLRPFAVPSLDALWLRIVVVLALGLTVFLIAVSGTFRPAEQQLNDLAFAALERPASGQVHLVEMDAASMAAIQSWPWPRDHYARLIQQLDAAGVNSISFDVDFSGSADPAGDMAFGAAIAAAKAPVALPTFAQNANFRSGRQLDSLPIAPLRDHAHLASVSVNPDRDGFVRRMPLGTITGDTARPSIAAFVAGGAGAAGQSFPIDFAIDPASIPRHSFIAVERGLFSPDQLKGKDVIVGATAIELGDRYPVPRHGVVPGVIVQALAAETLQDGVPSYGGWQAPLALMMVIAVLACAANTRRVVLHNAIAVAGICIIAWLAMRTISAAWFEIVPALSLLGLCVAARLAILTQRAAAVRKQIDSESGLPNRRALDAVRDRSADRFVIAAQIDDFEALKLAVSMDHVGEVLRRLVERLQVVTSAATIYRTEDRTLVWRTALEIDEIEPLMAGLRAILRSPFDVAGRRLGVSISFGVADANAPDPAANAAHAASLAKRSGKPWRLHSDSEGATVAAQFSLLGELDDALRDGHVIVHYQPKRNLVSDRIDAAEALVRWRHPVRGMLPPDCFIPLIEEAGRIDDLTLAVLAQSLADMRQWRTRGLAIDVAVNISAALLASDSFASKALAIVAQAGVPAQHLTFEVTESAQFEDTDKAIAILTRFRAAGIKIAMDDYGTGQSTLNYLKLLPVTELKIDRSFVQHAHIDHGDAMLVRSTVQLAHELGITVVAEGIEDAGCLAFLQAIGCDYAQGYFIGRPMPAGDLAALVVQPVAAAA